MFSYVLNGDKACTESPDHPGHHARVADLTDIPQLSLCILSMLNVHAQCDKILPAGMHALASYSHRCKLYTDCKRGDTKAGTTI